MVQQSLRARAAAGRKVGARVTKARRQFAQSKSANQSKHAAGRTEELKLVPQEDDTRTEKVYIGQGRYVDDDPRKYPDKNGLGVGGWAGGEQGASC
jgi:hypothetical protein